MRMSLCPSIWRSRWAWRCIWHVTPNPETGNSQPGSDRAFASPETGDAWLKAERGEKVWISKYRWRKNLAPVGMVATSWNTVIIHTMYMIYGLLWCQLLQGFCSSSTHFNAYCVFCRMFLYKISPNIIMINVQFAKAFIIRQATTQFQHLSMLQVQSVSFPSLSGHHTHESEPSFKDSISCHDLIEAFGGVEAHSRTKAWSKVQRDCNSTLPIMHCVSPNCGTPTHHFLLYETMAARF